MKRLIVALVAAVAFTTAFAKLTDTQSFETSFSDFVASIENEDASALVDYNSDQPSFAAPYNFDNFGSKYLALDTGDATLWRTNADDAAYFDMAMQFNPCAAAPEIDVDTKIAVYLNSSSNLVVLAGDGANGTETNVTETTLNPGTWARLTIAKNGTDFDVYLNTTKIGTYASLTGDATIKSVGFKGTGALDDFVARTTDPFLNSTVKIDGEYYASVDAALADDPTATVEITADAVTSKVLANAGDSISVKLNGHALTGLTAAGSLVPVASLSGDVTTYTANYFPRTATAGQDGTASNPYEIADADDLVALQAAVLADAANSTTFAAKSYVQTADIDMTGTAGFWGIGWFTSSDAKDASITASGNIPFTGVFDGAGYTISNVQMVRHNYAGVFNCLEGTVKDLTVSNFYFTGTQGEQGCGVIGNAQGNALVENVTSAGTAWGWDPENRPNDVGHNSGGIACRAEDNATFRYCVNNASFTSGARRLGGILGFTGGTEDTDSVKIVCCTNNGNLTSTYEANKGRGVGGIIASPESYNSKVATTGHTNTIIRGCANFGTLTASNSGNPTGAIVGTMKVGTTCSFVDDGGNTFLASAGIVGDRGSNTTVIPGLAYAVDAGIDGGDYLTTVKQADLAAGNTYTLLANVADSETPVFTLAEATDTIAFDTAKGFTFAGTVAVDRSKLTPATSVTVGTVTTYSTVAGVASVDNLAYATFEDAVAALDGETADNFVTLLDDVSTTISAGTTLNVKVNGHQFTANKASDDVLISYSIVDGVTTYTATEGMASCNGTWYATFTAAYDAALAASGNAKMVVKITDDFTPAISATYNHFYSLEFVDARADQTEGLTINLKNAAGTAYMASSQYFFPANATLVLAADFSHANATGIISGGTLEIPEGVTVTINVSPYWAFYKRDGSAGISAIAGTGTILLPNNTFDASTASKTMFNSPNRCFPSLLRNNSWQGTLELVGTSDDKVCDLSQVANPGSKIRFNGFTAPTFGGDNSTYDMGIELVGDGLTLTGDYTRNYTFTGSLKGTGSLSVANTKPTSLMFTGDVSGFTGSVTASGTSAAVTFGTSTTGSGQRIVVQSGKTATIGAGATWTATNLVLLGELTVNGTLAVNDNCIWGDKGAGVLRYANKDTLPTNDQFASSWNSKCIIACNPGNTRFVLNNFGNANSTLEIAGDNGVFSALPSTDNTAGTAPSIHPAVVLNANWTINNGWATNKNTGASNATTFANLSGGGNLTVNGTASGTDPIYYCITTLDGYTGVLGGKRGAFVVDKVNVAEMPTNGAIVVKTNIGTYGSINDNVPLYVADVDTGKTLTYDANGADGAGLYYIVPVARIEGGDSYPTLGAAVAAATSGATVTLLSNITLDERVEPSLGANTTLTIDLGGFTITREGTSGNGSVIDVKSGAVTITNGVINCTQDDTAIAKDGVYAITARSGAELTLDALTVTVNSECGACVYPFSGATVAILGGAYANNTTTPYRYKTAWTGMAVNQVNPEKDGNVRVQRITIYGGSFKQVNPALGDDSWTDGTGTFLAEGKTTTWNASEGYWDVGDAGTPVEPGKKDTTKYDDAQAATNAAVSVKVAVPDAVASALSSEQQNTYKGMFETKVVENGDGTYSVAVEMKDEVVAEVQTAVDAATATTLEEVLDVEAGADANVSVTTKPGLYYAIAVGTSLPLTAPASEAYEMATDTTKTLKVRKPTTGTAAFFRVYCSETK